MIEAIMLPYLEYIELQKFSCLAKSYRSLFSPGNKRCINFETFFSARFPEQDISKIKDCATFRTVLEFLATFMSKMFLIHDNTYRRFDKVAGKTEYLGWGGGTYCDWIGDARYYKQTDESITF